MALVTTNTQVVANSIKTIISQFDNIDREGLKDTPDRYARMMQEFLTKPQLKISVFDAHGYDEMIVDTGIAFYSLCEHHLVPFFGTATIGYIPGNRVIGLSKLARTVDYFARGFQIQERMTTQIAEFLNKELRCLGVGVIIKARHLCREMRGIKKQGEMITSCLMGEMRKDEKARNEFLSFK